MDDRLEVARRPTGAAVDGEIESRVVNAIGKLVAAYCVPILFAVNLCQLRVGDVAQVVLGPLCIDVAAIGGEGDAFLSGAPRIGGKIAPSAFGLQDER